MRTLFELALLVPLLAPLASAQPPTAPLPDIRHLIQQVQDHQKQLEKVRENYTYTSLETTQDLDSNGQVSKTETEEAEHFFVNGHMLARTIKKNNQPLSDHDQQKETERITKLVEKAQNTPPDQPLESQSVSVSRVLEIMDVRNPRRQLYNGRPAILFDFIGRRDAKTHGIAEDASKKLQGTLWIDEADRQVAHMEVQFNDNFHVAGGLVASIQKGSSFRFDQAPINGELWLPTGAEANVQARILLLKAVRQHFTEHSYGYKRFSVETQQPKDARVAPGKAP